MSHRAAVRESLAAVCDLIGQKKKVTRIRMLCHASPASFTSFPSLVDRDQDRRVTLTVNQHPYKSKVYLHIGIFFLYLKLRSYNKGNNWF